MNARTLPSSQAVGCARLHISRRVVSGCVALLAASLIATAALTTAPALALPEGRAYEMVSPPYKGGYNVNSGSAGIVAVAPNGDGVVFRSQGVFNGQPAALIANAYLARREASGWSSVPLEPPSALVPATVEKLTSVRDFSPTLQSALAAGLLAANVGISFESPETVFLLHRTDLPDIPENWQQAGGVLEALSEKRFSTFYQGASQDFCHVLFRPTESVSLLKEAVGTRAETYDLATGLTGCSGEPGLRLVGLNNSGKVIDPYCSETLGSPAYGPNGSTFNAVADGGGEVFFTAYVEPGDRAVNCGGATRPVPANPSQLFVRLGGSRTVEVSRPLEAGPFGGCVAKLVPGEVPCAGAASRAPAFFLGASEDGSRVFFTTTARLVGEDKDAGNDLYMASIGCPPVEPGCEVAQRQVTSLVQVSHASSGDAAEVQDVVRVAPDGSRVYFVARGRLGEAPGVEGLAAVKGADNLYVLDSATGRTVFIAELCSGPGLSGVVEDARCPSDLEGEGEGELKPRNDTGVWERSSEVQTAGPESDPARFLVFSTYAQLIAHGPGADTDNAKDVYRYDALTGALDRVSVGEAGLDANGNCNDGGGGGSACNAMVGSTEPRSGKLSLYAQREMGSRAISEDGSRIVFQTAEPLSSVASNGLVNVYEWHKEPGWSEGRVSLVSTGSAPVSESNAVITPSGNDVFFVTSQGLLPQDTDGQGDVYDERLKGSFPPGPAERQPCSGDACQGPLTNPAPLLVPGSVPQAPGGNFTAPASKAKAKKAKPKKAKRKARRKGRSSGVRGRSGTTAGRSGR
jgi:hypothetical protein